MTIDVSVVEWRRTSAVDNYNTYCIPDGRGQLDMGFLSHSTWRDFNKCYNDQSWQWVIPNESSEPLNFTWMPFNSFSVLFLLFHVFYQDLNWLIDWLIDRPERQTLNHSSASERSHSRNGSIFWPILAPQKTSWRNLKRFKSYRVDKQTDRQTDT